jgi:hypothetical protein
MMTLRGMGWNTLLRCKTAGIVLVACALVVAVAVPATGAPTSTTIVVAAADSSERGKAGADFVADGEADQEEVNAAIRALPPVGGTVQLLEGTFQIRKIEGTLGGVLIERSHVTLAGQGAGTKLMLAAGQNTNVIRIIGSGVGQVIIRDLFIDANRAENDQLRGDPNVSHDRFEVCGIKAYRRAPGGPEVPDATHDVTVRNCIVKNAQRLNIMLEGPNMRVIDNVLGNAGSDSVEILTGPGQIRGNYVEITGQTHVAIGSDRGNSIIMSDNIVHVLDGGRLDIGFRSWSDSRQHVISSNIVTVEPGGHCTLAMDVRGDGAAVTGNSVHSPQTSDQIRLKIAGGNTVVTGNLLENAVLEINDETGRGLPIRLSDNILHESSVEVLAGEVVSGESSP